MLSHFGSLSGPICSILDPNLPPKKGPGTDLSRCFWPLNPSRGEDHSKTHPQNSPRPPKEPPKTLPPQDPPKTPKDFRNDSPQRLSPKTCKTDPRATKTTPKRPSGPLQDPDEKLECSIQIMQKSKICKNIKNCKICKKHRKLQKDLQCLSAATMVGNSQVGGSGPSP